MIKTYILDLKKITLNKELTELNHESISRARGYSKVRRNLMTQDCGDLRIMRHFCVVDNGYENGIYVCIGVWCLSLAFGASQ
jgi:hypothetical protein